MTDLLPAPNSDTAGAVEGPVAAEADWATAPGLLDGAMTLELSVDDCDLAYWFNSVAQGTMRGRTATGYLPGTPTPAHMTVPGPLRESLSTELAYRSIAEEKATRILAQYVAEAPGIPEMDFYATQLVDEARHSMVFRKHLVDMGYPAATLLADIAEMGRAYTAEVLDPVEEFALQVVRDEHDFVGGVAIFTIVIEGVLAPAAELSERKWDPLDPAASEIARGAAIDEIRHLTVGSSIIREHLIEHPEYRPRLLEILEAGVELWDRVPDKKYVMAREELFQQGMEQHADLVGDYELFPGRKMIETTPEERYDIAERWTDQMAEARMAYMGLEGVLTAGRGQ